MAEWVIRTYNKDDDQVAEFIPEDLEFSRIVNDNGTFTCELSLAHPAATKDYIYPRRHQYKILREGVALQGGLITEVDVNLEEDKLQIAGADWLWYLKNRRYPWNANDPNLEEYRPAPDTDVADVLKDIFDAIMVFIDSVHFTYPDLNTPTGQTIGAYIIGWFDCSYIYGKINDLAERTPGFDYEITPDKEFKIYVPYKSALSATQTFTHPGTIELLNVTNHGIGGTHMIGTNNSGARPRAKLRFSNVVAGANWKFDVSEQFDTVDDDVLAARTQSWLNSALQTQRTFDFGIVPDAMPDIWEDFQAGDEFNLEANNGYEVLDGTYRALSITGRVNRQGDEFISVGVEADHLSG